jgi:regulator of CtrA degradation
LIHRLSPFPLARACGKVHLMTSQPIRARLTPKLVDSLYVEAMVLADEARAYFDRNGKDDRMALDPLLRVGFSVESLKVTTRLMHIIAWLLTQRAVETGELTPAQGRAKTRRLGEAPVSDPAVVGRLPEAAVHLVQASQDLFARVSRLDEGSVTAEPKPSPARSLMSRLERSL